MSLCLKRRREGREKSLLVQNSNLCRDAQSGWRGLLGNCLAACQGAEGDGRYKGTQAWALQDIARDTPLAPSPNGLGDWRGEFEALCGLEANKIDSSLKAQLGTQPLLLAWCLPSYVQWSKLGSPARLGFSICELCHTKV